LSVQLLKQVEQGNEIPRVIHVTFGSKQLPDALMRNVQSMRELNPDWVVRVYDDEDIENYIAANFGPNVLKTYLKIDAAYGPARADLFRYLLIYNEGGCYLDVKSGMSRPMDAVLRRGDRFLLSQWRNGPGEKNESFGLWEDLAGVPGGEYQQWHVISVRGHPFLRAVLLRVLGNIALYRPERVGTGKLGVLRTTGPIAYTLAIDAIRERHVYRYVCAEQDLGLHYSICADHGNGTEHARFFTVHYSQLTHPVIALTPGKRLTWRLYLLMRGCYHRLQIALGEQGLRPVKLLIRKAFGLSR
jgi:mannosyltransferase OCH1-like enzyme